MTFRELVNSIPESDWDLPVFISDRCDNCYPVYSVYSWSIESEEDYEKGCPYSVEIGNSFIKIGC